MNSDQSQKSTALAQIEGSEIEAAKKWFPGLKFETANGVTKIFGNLAFTGRYDKKRRKYIFFDSTQDPHLIEESFEVEILTGTGINPYRNVRVPDQKIIDIAKRLDCAVLRLHVQDKEIESFEVEILTGTRIDPYRNVRVPDQKIVDLAKRLGLRLHVQDKEMRMCVNGYLDEDQSIGLVEFLIEKVAKSLYDIVFFGKFGYWPTGEFAHGSMGVMENYFLVMQKKNSDIVEEAKKCIATLNQIYLDNQDSMGVSLLKKALSKRKIPPSTKCPSCRIPQYSPEGIMHKRIMDCHPKAFAGMKILKKVLKKHPQVASII